MRSNQNADISRRNIVKTAAVGAAFSILPGILQARKPAHEFSFGIRTVPDNATKLKELGFDFIEVGTLETLQPEMSDADYAPLLAKLKTCALPMRSCNGFIPKSFRLTGPETDHDAALKYALTACRRADELGIPFIVLGSGSARRAPEGFDLAKANAQFIEFSRRLGDQIKDFKVTIVVEPLNKSETNVVNTVVEGINCVKTIDHERVRLLADFYHMLREGESPDSIRKAGPLIRHCHIAELEGRMAPGTKGEDLSGFFAALKQIGYVGGISCECQWPGQDVEVAWAKALATLRTQSRA